MFFTGFISPALGVIVVSELTLRSSCSIATLILWPLPNREDAILSEKQR